MPPRPRRPRRRFDSPTTSRSGEDCRTSIGSRSRCRNRGDVRDALSRTLPTVPETGNGPSALSPRNVALLGSLPVPAPPNQPNCTAGCELVRHNWSFLGVTASGSWHPVKTAYATGLQTARTAGSRALNTGSHVYEYDKDFIRPLRWHYSREHFFQNPPFFQNPSTTYTAHGILPRFPTEVVPKRNRRAALSGLMLFGTRRYCSYQKNAKF